MKKLSLVLFLVLMMPACAATPQDTARTVVSVTAAGVRAVDIVSAQAYTDRARTALASFADLAAYRAAMAPVDALEESLRIADQALLAAEAVVDAWDAGGSAQWMAVAACVAAALERIRAAIENAGVTLPAELVSALETARAFVGECPSPPVPASAGGSTPEAVAVDGGAS